jgi:(5-formylfuran-3-yl)methyl phosphate synthase
MTLSAQEGLTSDSSPNRCQLLVSVRDSHETAICLDAGVDWIDLKEPHNGSLGMPSLSTAKSVHRVLHNYPRRSVALGELADQPSILGIQELSQLFPYVKLGLAGLAGRKDWPEQLNQIQRQIAGSLVPVIYADWPACRAPEPGQVLDWISDFPSPYVLIDTFRKDGSNLLEHLDAGQLRSIIDQAASLGSGVLLGGSLTVTQLPVLLPLPCAAIAVRGAVCPGDRSDSISQELVGNWVAMVQQRIPLPTG